MQRYYTITLSMKGTWSFNYEVRNTYNTLELKIYHGEENKKWLNEWSKRNIGWNIDTQYKSMIIK